MSTADKKGCKGCLPRIFQLTERPPGGKSINYYPTVRAPAPSKPKEAIKPKQRDLPYKIRYNFLTPTELKFYSILKEIVEDRAIICPKVRMIDLFYVHPREDFSHKARIIQKHVDFTLCLPREMRPVLCIELDDASHYQDDRIERDNFIDDVFISADLPLIHQPVQSHYNTDLLRSLILPYFYDSMPSNVPKCPNCNRPMVIKIAKHGEHKGKQFWACPNYPECKEVIPVTKRNIPN